ncbi:hypothetical protein Droror1_Dr00007169 [Drosera rotundifolia]
MANENNGTNIMSQPDSTPESGDSELAMMYYGLGIVAAAGLLLLAYNIIVIKCCVNRSTRRRVDGAPTALVMLSWQGRSNQGMAARRRVEELVSFKYQKDEEAASVGSVECTVCLSMFEEGEDIKQLPRNADGFESWHTFMAHQAGPLLLPSFRWWHGTSGTGLLDMDLDLDLDHGSVSWSSQDLVSWKEQPREGKGEQSSQSFSKDKRTSVKKMFCVTEEDE